MKRGPIMPDINGRDAPTGRRDISVHPADRLRSRTQADPRSFQRGIRNIDHRHTPHPARNQRLREAAISASDVRNSGILRNACALE